MKWLVELALASVVLVLGGVGCTQSGDPAAFAAGAAPVTAGASPDATGGCNVSTIPAGSGKIDEIGSELARVQAGFVDAMQANEEADHTRERHLTRVAMALTLDQQRAFLAAYEATDPVKKVRQTYAAKTLQLAAKLDEIDRSDDLARYASQTEPGLLFSAYDLLSQSACPARSIRFAGMVLGQVEGAPNRYPGLVDTNAKSYALKYIFAGAAGAMVERAIDSQSSPEAVLPELHAWLGTVNGPAGALLDVVKDKQSVLEASRLGKPIVVLQQDALPVVQAVGTVLAVWGAGEAAANGDLSGLVHSGPGGIAAVLNGTNALRRAFGLDELVWAGKAAGLAGQLASGIGLVTDTLALLEGIRTMHDRDDVIRTLGNALLLYGSIVALSGGSASLIIVAGTAAKILADILATPPADEVKALLGTLAAAGVIPTESVQPLTDARNGSLRNLHEDLGLPPQEVLWMVTRSSDAASSDGGYHGLVQIGATFALSGDKMTAFLHGITDPSDLVWQRWELYMFMGFVNLSESFQQSNPASMRDALHYWATTLTTGDAEAKQWGKPRDEMTAHARGVFQRALAALP